MKDLATEQRMNCVSSVTGRARLHIAQSISVDPISLAVARDRQRQTGDLPFLHSFADAGVEIVGKSVRHASASFLLRDPAFDRVIRRASSTINPF